MASGFCLYKARLRAKKYFSTQIIDVGRQCVISHINIASGCGKKAKLKITKERRHYKVEGVCYFAY